MMSDSHITKKAVHCALFILMLLWSWSAAAQLPGQQQVEAIGTGSITYNDVAAARDRAIDDALRKAVEQTLGTYIDSQTRVQNYMVVEDRILSWSRGYVSNYQITSELKKTPELYEVRMLATVNTSDLQRDADAVRNLIMSMGNPRVMILFDEQNIGQSYDKYYYFDVDMTASETAMMNKFLEKDFQVVDPTTVRQNKERDAILAAINGDNKAAASLALKQDAEVVITGKAVAKVATGINLAGMKSCQANLTARVIDADVGTVIATGSQHAAYPHIDEVTGGTLAIEKAAKALSDDLISKILAKWQSRFYDLNTVKISVMGLASYTQASDFKNALQYTARGVKNVFQRDLSGGTAEFDIQITGNAEQLARELDQRQIGDFAVAVIGASANKVTLRASMSNQESPADSL
ncbi:hypothetical protein A2V82_11925 [candidate division KSB1 bacterium RBG_16_48_16]|nr:MAG: hypothetical protein A2V82_11925 [candidate division KSB1 bacterium RBG_16_48_16]